MKPGITCIRALFNLKVESSRIHSNFTLARSPGAIFILAIKALAAGFSRRAKSLQFSRFHQLFEESIVIGHNRPAYTMQERFEAR
jgi:hypothetical protein